MGDLLNLLSSRLDANARAEVDAYALDFSEYRREAARPKARAEMLEYAVWTRRRTVDLVRDGRILGDDDLSYIATIGQQRARLGFSTAVVQQVLSLHTNLMLREIHDAADNNDLEDLLHLMAWLGAQGARGSAAFLEGYTNEQKNRLSTMRRLRMLTQLLLSNDPTVPRVALDLGLRVPDHYVVVVVRIPSQPFRSDDTAHDDLVEIFFKVHPLPIIWYQPNELVVLIPSEDTGLVLDLALTDERPVSIVRDLVAMVGRPCRVGAASGPVSALTKAMEQARRVAEAVPAQTLPSALLGIADVFVELGVAHLPEVDCLLRAIAQRLDNGPDLMTTLDTYYNNNMNRLFTAVALHIHPRTLDYRLQRVRDLVHVDPSSVRGIRILTAAVRRALAGAWS